MLHGLLRRRGTIHTDRLALNDIVVTRGALARMIEVSVAVDGQSVCELKADGLIVATPTGSTAYNLSTGGPIIAPGAEVISICPICPHTLTNRPLVQPYDVQINLKLNTGREEVMLTSDGQTGMPLMAGDRVEIIRSAETFNTVSARDRDYFEILRSKLKWSGR